EVATDGMIHISFCGRVVVVVVVGVVVVVVVDAANACGASVGSTASAKANTSGRKRRAVATVLRRQIMSGVLSFARGPSTNDGGRSPAIAAPAPVSCPLVIQPAFTRCKRGPECGRAALRRYAPKRPARKTMGGRFPRASPRRPTGQGATTCACPLRGVDRTRTYSPRDISHAPAGRLELEGIMMLW